MAIRGTELTDRDREILRDVIQTFVLSGEPVSRRVAKHDQHDLSAATIRNVMADLEELGYLAQPHTSAGRVPTSQGYHFFIESLMPSGGVSADERRIIEEQLAAAESDGGHLATAASQLLSQLSRNVGVVLIPAIGGTTLRSVEFVPLSGRKVLCVSVSSVGFIENKVIETERPYSREELIEISNYLTLHYAGSTLREMRDHLVTLMENARAQMNQLLMESIRLAQKGLNLDDEPDLVVEGADLLLGQESLSDLGQVRSLFEMFRNKARLVSLLNRCMDGEGVRVTIGEDSELTSELGMSLIFKSYGVDERTAGGLGILGPSRMEYSRIIPLVDYLGEQLSQALARTM